MSHVRAALPASPVIAILKGSFIRIRLPTWVSQACRVGLLFGRTQWDFALGKGLRF